MLLRRKTKYALQLLCCCYLFADCFGLRKLILALQSSRRLRQKPGLSVALQLSLHLGEASHLCGDTILPGKWISCLRLFPGWLVEIFFHETEEAFLGTFGQILDCFGWNRLAHKQAGVLTCRLLFPFLVRAASPKCWVNC